MRSLFGPPYVRWDPDHQREGHFEGKRVPFPGNVATVRMANVPAQRTWRTSALAAAKGNTTTMQPLAKLL